MAVELVISEQAGILRVELTGTRELDRVDNEAHAVWSRVADECRARNRNRVLAVSRLQGPLPPFKAYRVATSFAAYTWDRGFKLAFVDLNEESRSDNEFAALVARNRGWIARVFCHESEAIEWLHSPSVDLSEALAERLADCGPDVQSADG